MKKLIVYTLVTLMFSTSTLFSPFVYADSLSNSESSSSVDKFEITSGINKLRNTEATFDDVRIITGTAPVDTTVIITVCKKPNSSNNLQKIKSYEVKVGYSGYFSQPVDLSIGENYISIVAQNGSSTASVNSTVNRKKSEIKTELKQIIALPSSVR